MSDLRNPTTSVLLTVATQAVAQDARGSSPLHQITPARWRTLFAAVDLLTAALPAADVEALTSGGSGPRAVASATVALRESIAQLEYLAAAGEAADERRFLSRPIAGDRPPLAEREPVFETILQRP